MTSKDRIKFFQVVLEKKLKYALRPREA